MKFFVFFTFLFFFTLTFFSFPMSTHAAGGFEWDTSCFENMAGAEGVATLQCLPSVVKNATNGFLLLSGAVALFIIVWAGIRYITSGGDAKQMGSARSMITYAIIGLIVVLSSYAILFFIGFVTNTSDCITNLKSLTNGCQ